MSGAARAGVNARRRNAGASRRPPIGGRADDHIAPRPAVGMTPSPVASPSCPRMRAPTPFFYPAAWMAGTRPADPRIPTAIEPKCGRQRPCRRCIARRPMLHGETRSRSSAGQSSGFLNRRSQVRVLSGPPQDQRLAGAGQARTTDAPLRGRNASCTCVRMLMEVTATAQHTTSSDRQVVGAETASDIIYTLVPHHLYNSGALCVLRNRTVCRSCNTGAKI